MRPNNHTMNPSLVDRMHAHMHPHQNSMNDFPIDYFKMSGSSSVGNGSNMSMRSSDRYTPTTVNQNSFFNFNQPSTGVYYYHNVDLLKGTTNQLVPWCGSVRSLGDTVENISVASFLIADYGVDNISWLDVAHLLLNKDGYCWIIISVIFYSTMCMILEGLELEVKLW